MFATLKFLGRVTNEIFESRMQRARERLASACIISAAAPRS
jgi:hypothetical protein